MSASDHILVLGATGVSGLIFIKHVQSLPASTRPKLTLYVRSRGKIPEKITSDSTIRILEGALNDEKRLDDAMNGITAVVSFLGAYVSLKNFLTRATGPCPISDAMPVVFDAMRKNGVKRVLTLSTPSGFPQKGEEPFSWYWWIFGILMPRVVVPQGDAEMKGIALATANQDDLDWTVYRVPHLTEGPDEKELAVGIIDKDYKGTIDLSRWSLARWVLQELREGKWIKQGPMVTNSA